jgi:hypothetical protein
VLGADAVEEVVVAAFGALLDDAGSAGGVGAYGLDGEPPWISRSVLI